MKVPISKWLMVIATLVSLMFIATGLEAKKDKPDRTESEWIEFTGALVGGDEVEGCCPNNGPFPEYVMTLPDGLGDNIPEGIYDGQLFLNRYGSGRDQKYKVQFWNSEIAIEIIGGVIDNDKKNKILTVKFTDEPCVDLYTKEFIADVSFELVRTPL